MTYTTNDLSKLSGYSPSTICSHLHRSGFEPVGIAGINQNVWSEECLAALLKKKRIQERESTILLTSLATMFNMSVPEVRKILSDKDIKPVMVERNELNGGLVERYDSAVREVIAKHLDDLKMDNANDHPLVTDERCLKTNWFPDVVPECFKDIDEEIA